MLSRFFQTIDFFKSPVRLNLNKSEFYSMHLGQFLSICIIAVLIYSFATSDVFYKQVPKTYEKTLQLPRYNSFNFTNNNFFIAVQVANQVGQGYTYDRTMFRFVAYYQKMAIKNGTVGQQLAFYEELEMVPCNQTNYKAEFQQIVKYHPNSMCLPKTNFEVYGALNEERTSVVGIQLNYCQNSSTSNITCQSAENITKFFTSKYFAYSVIDNQVDLTDYENPFKMSQPAKSLMLEPNVRKNHRVYMNQMIINTDAGFLLDDWQEMRNWKSGEETDDFDFRKDSPTIARLTMFASNSEMTYSRQYLKIQEALASLGGILNFLILIGFILLKVIPYKGINHNLANNLFSFPTDSKISNDSKESPIRRQETLTKKTVLLEIQNMKTNTEGNQFQMTILPLSPKQGADPLFSPKQFRDDTLFSPKQLGDAPLSPTQISPCLGDKTEIENINSQLIIERMGKRNPSFKAPRSGSLERSDSLSAKKKRISRKASGKENQNDGTSKLSREFSNYIRERIRRMRFH